MDSALHDAYLHSLYCSLALSLTLQGNRTWFCCTNTDETKTRPLLRRDHLYGDMKMFNDNASFISSSSDSNSAPRYPLVRVNLRKSANKPELRSSLTLSELHSFGQGWLISCDLAYHSPRTIASRRDILKKLEWFLITKRYDVCDTDELKHFMSYMKHGHDEVGGRWGNPRMTKPMSARSVATYRGHLVTFFRWVKNDEGIDKSPMDRIAATKIGRDDICPFTIDQVRALLQAAKRTRSPKRDEAIVLLLIDTGIRVSELCGLMKRDVDFHERKINILGKGNKHRTVPMGVACAKSLWSMLSKEQRDEDDYLFMAERGRSSGDPLTRNGVYQLFERLGKDAGIKGVRCSPHTARHTFAIEYLRAGGDTFTLQLILGHVCLSMTRRYAMIADSDAAAKHRTCSPGDRIVRG